MSETFTQVRGIVSKAMNCIDAIEGAAKKVISDFHAKHETGEMDDTEFVRSTRILIDGTGDFVVDNCEITPNPELLKTVLFEYARDLWKNSLDAKAEHRDTSSEDEGYDDYYFDYIFRHGTYPE
ncbi:hypothetical protein DSLASN_07180 [Desulfoluna limicola]|uniref:Uncharacterized protein n=2 Tax=Desulfoluna limicola TaxID=2810562 RepID=A0ABN6F0K4_9BACT|nr:hypothetical protein DSLASN_07180 [Desulfoluna limicola]